MEELITTISGKQCKKSECRLIEKQYYLIGKNNVENSGDVYLLDNRYIRENTGRVVFNNSSKSYQLKNDSLDYGIVSMDQESNFIFGYFNQDVNCQLLIDKNQGTHKCINEEIINRNFREELSTGYFYHISLMKACRFNLIKNVKKELKESLPYDSKGIMGKYIERYNNNYKPVINHTIEKFSKAIGGLTFGFEFETVKGVIPNNKLSLLPLIPLRDGSIGGLEYVTIPLSGAKGIKALIDCVKELEKRTEYNNDCSLHLHLGNIPRTPEFILAFYKLISSHQEEMFSLFPLYKKYNFGVKRKNYSEPFPFNDINCRLDAKINPKDKPQVNQNFDVLFSHLTGQHTFYDYGCDLINVDHHPADPQGNQKWNIKKRYYAYNLIPLIFGNKETIEFRIHTPTYDIDKILNFLFINSYLINYTIANQDKILSDPSYLCVKNNKGIGKLISNHFANSNFLTGNDKDALANYHHNYIEERRRVTYEDNCKGNIIGNEDSINCYRSINWKEEESFNKYNVNNLKYNYIGEEDGELKASLSYRDWDSLRKKTQGQIKMESTIGVSKRRGTRVLTSYGDSEFPRKMFGEGERHFNNRVSEWNQLSKSAEKISGNEIAEGIYIDNPNRELEVELNTKYLEAIKVMENSIRSTIASPSVQSGYASYRDSRKMVTGDGTINNTVNSISELDKAVKYSLDKNDWGWSDLIPEYHTVNLGIEPIEDLKPESEPKLVKVKSKFW
jgi:hypothetical protein